MKAIVIFYHPGAEYHINSAMLKKGVMPWNTLPFHRRKFLEAQGHYILNGNLNPQAAQLRFWGEWEPDSCILPLQMGSSPKFLHIPFLRQPLPALPTATNVPCLVKPGCGVKLVPQRGLQNTDPFVFADSFYYGICQQMTKAGNYTKMAKLDIGSIILFGSCVNGEFALDTVFVVGDKKPYTPQTMSQDLDGYAPAIYPQIMQLSGTQQFVCYRGASYSIPYNGMYSFVPCRLADGSDYGFDRPVLRVTDFQSCNMCKVLSNGAQNQGRKVSEVTDAEAKQVWECVRKSIISQNFIEGFNFKYKQSKHCCP